MRACKWEWLYVQMGVITYFAGPVLEPPVQIWAWEHWKTKGNLAQWATLLSNSSSYTVNVLKQDSVWAVCGRNSLGTARTPVLGEFSTRHTEGTLHKERELLLPILYSLYYLLRSGTLYSMSFIICNPRILLTFELAKQSLFFCILGCQWLVSVDGMLAKRHHWSHDTVSWISVSVIPHLCNEHGASPLSLTLLDQVISPEHDTQRSLGLDSTGSIELFRWSERLWQVQIAKG